MRKQQKKRCRAAFSVILSLVTVLCMVMSTKAAYLNMEVIPQDPDPAVGELCCWACCGTSVCRYYGRNMTVHNFVYRSKVFTVVK